MIAESSREGRKDPGTWREDSFTLISRLPGSSIARSANQKQYQSKRTLRRSCGILHARWLSRALQCVLQNGQSRTRVYFTRQWLDEHLSGMVMVGSLSKGLTRPVASVRIMRSSDSDTYFIPGCGLAWQRPSPMCKVQRSIFPSRDAAWESSALPYYLESGLVPPQRLVKSST